MSQGVGFYKPPLPLGSTENYRMAMPARQLGAGVVELGEGPLEFDHEIVVFVGPLHESWFGALDQARADGHQILFEADDNYLTEYRPLFIGNEASDRLFYKHRAGYVRQLQRANGLIVSTPVLAERFAEVIGAEMIAVCPNAVDPSEWPPLQPHAESRPFTVGFAGASSHSDDVGLIRDALRVAEGKPRRRAVVMGRNPASPVLTLNEMDEWLRRSFEMYGEQLERLPTQLKRWKDPRPGETRTVSIDRNRPPPWEVGAEFAERVRARRDGWLFPFVHIPWTDSFAAYAESLGQLDVGLCPLLPNDYNDCRSDVKILEYGMAGVLPLVSDAPPYAEWKGSPVLFARSSEEFVEHVKWAADNPAEVRERAMAVREKVLADRAMPAAVEPWRQALGEMTLEHDPEDWARRRRTREATRRAEQALA